MTTAHTNIHTYGQYTPIESQICGCTSIMRISCSTRSERSVRLRSADCAGHLNSVNSLNSQDDLSFVTVSCSSLTRVTPSIMFCCCSPSASKFNMLWIQKCLGCNKWLSELLLPSYQVEAAWPPSPLTSGINKVLLPRELLLTG